MVRATPATTLPVTRPRLTRMFRMIWISLVSRGPLASRSESEEHPDESVIPARIPPNPWKTNGLDHGAGPVSATRQRVPRVRALADAHDRQAQRAGRRVGDRRVGGRDGLDALVRRARRPGAGRRSPLLGQKRHRALGLRGDGQRRVDAEVGGDRGAVDDVQAGVAVEAVVGVDDAGLGVSRRSAQPPRKCAVIGMLNSSPTVPPGKPSMSLGEPADGLVAGRDPGRVGRAVALPGGETGARPSRLRLVNVVSELSRDCMTSAMMVRSDQRRRSRGRRTLPAALPHLARARSRQRGAARRRRSARSAAAHRRWSPCRSGPARCGCARPGGTTR